MVAAAGENWEINKAHTEEVVGIIEAIMKEGIVSRKFGTRDPVRDARNVMTALTPFYRPVRVEQGIREGKNTAAHLWDQIEFFIRALGGVALRHHDGDW